MQRGGLRHAEYITHRTLLFLFNIHTKEIFGVFGATAHVQVDWVPEAFGGRFPVQVRLAFDKLTAPQPLGSLHFPRLMPCSQSAPLFRTGPVPHAQQLWPCAHVRLRTRPHDENPQPIRASAESSGGEPSPLCPSTPRGTLIAAAVKFTCRPSLALADLGSCTGASVRSPIGIVLRAVAVALAKRLSSFPPPVFFALFPFIST